MPDGTRLTDNIAPAFHHVHAAIRNHRFTHYWLCGGRGSTKSSFAAIQTVLAVKRGTNAVVIRKVGETLRDSVFAQVLWAISLLRLDGEFTASVSPMEIKHASGYRILFRGLDKPEKLKSLTFTKGYAGFVWFEEADQLHGMAEVRNVLQTLVRGGEKFTVLYSYNPPRHRNAWVNVEENVARDDRLVHRSCFTDVPRHWLGEVFFAEAEHLKVQDEKAYRHEYLGEPVGVGGVVFDNLDIRTITADEIKGFDRIYYGMDFGFDPDPTVLLSVHYDSKRRTLFIFDEYKAHRASTGEIGEEVMKRVGKASDVLCDSAEPREIRDLRQLGINAYPVKKGKDSVRYGMRWLQRLDSIVIDSKRCPLAAHEFVAYEYERTRDGEYTGSYPDRDNHAIDCARYALNAVIMAGRER